MGAGMLPAALSLTEGDSSFRQPMAIVVIGGVITSTLLSLIVIPVIFTFVDDLLEGIKRLLLRTGARHETASQETHAPAHSETIVFEPSPAKRRHGQRLPLR
jgi:predicted RND superfamily exporter protein